VTPMLAAVDTLDQLHRYEADRRAKTLTGSLLGLGLPERDQVLAQVFEGFEQDLAIARSEAANTGHPVRFEGAAISLTGPGDTWTVQPDGRMDRDYVPFPGFETLVERLSQPPALDETRAVEFSEVLQAAYHAFWSPSATNWQPTRVLEATGDFKQRLAAIAGWSAALVPSVMLLLRRDHYESLLGDVLEPFGLAVTAREESIDAGIFAETMAMSALSRGMTFREYVFAPHEVEGVAGLAIAELSARLDRLTDESEVAETERTKIAHLIDFLKRGKYLPDSLMVLGHACEPVEPFTQFDALIESHSTQRVASPVRDFSHAETELLWARTRAALPESERAAIDFAFYHWSEQTPPAIGSAMFEALYGTGADPDSKQGGTGGLLTAVTVRNYLLSLTEQDPGYVPGLLGAGWQDLDDAELQKVARAIGVRAQDVGRYLRERILRDGKYQVVDGLIADGNGKPMSIPVFVRLVRSLASTFGNFFLKFQNTHPQNAVILADTRAGETHRVFRTVGKVGAVLTYMARAMGASSIIKTGPIDLARDPIAAILGRNLDGRTLSGKWGEAIAQGVLLPAMTFQIGYPLSGSEVIEAGTPNEHTGYEERKRDKRPPRERFVDHFLPAF